MGKSVLFLVSSSRISVNYERSYVRRETREKRRRAERRKTPATQLDAVWNAYRVSKTFLFLRKQLIPSVPHIPLGT
jgi:hypothetical protein